MRIVHEKLEDENFMEVCLSPREYDLIKQYMIITTKCLIDGEITSLGIKLGLDLEDEIEEHF